MFERVKSLLSQRDELREVSALTDRDLSDLGLSRGQLEALVRMPRDIGERVDAMAHVFGVSAEQIRADHDHYIDLLYTCGHCRSRSACIQLLAQGDEAKPADAGFCLNKAAFELPHG